MFILRWVGEEDTKVLGVFTSFDENKVKEVILQDVSKWACPPEDLSLDSIVENDNAITYEKWYHVFEQGELYDEWNVYAVEKAELFN